MTLAIGQSPGLLFDGLNDYATLGNSALFDFGTLQDFTIEIRIKTPLNAGDPPILSNKDWALGGNAGYSIYTKGISDRWRVNIADGSNKVDAIGGYTNDNDWHLISISFDRDGNMELYQDGLLTGSADISGIGNINTGLPINIGQDGGGYPDFLTGAVDEIRIWNKVVTGATIQTWNCSELMGNHPDFANLIGYCKLNENTGLTSADETSNNNNLTIIDATWQVENSIPATCVGRAISITDCYGSIVSVDNSLLKPNVAYILHGFSSSISDFTPTCIARTNELGEIQPAEWVFCIDQPLANGIKSNLANEFQVKAGADLAPLPAARIAWILDNYEALGYSITNLRDVAKAIWSFSNPSTPSSYTCTPTDPWFSLCDGAITNVPVVPVQPTLALALSADESSMKQVNSMIQYDLTASNLSLELSVSDGGTMPMVCGGVGGSITDNGDGTGILTLISAGTVNLCLIRSTSGSVLLGVTDTSVFTDGSDMGTIRYYPTGAVRPSVSHAKTQRRRVLIINELQKCDF